MFLTRLFPIFKRDKVERLPPMKETNLLTYDQNNKESDENENDNQKQNSMSRDNEYNTNVDELPPEFKYLRELIEFRLSEYFATEDYDPLPDFPDPAQWQLPIGKFIFDNNSQINQDAALLLLIGLTPHVQPDLFDSVIEKKLPDSKQSTNDFPAIGGVRGRNCRFFLPTGETALFLIAGDSLARRLEIQKLFGAEHIYWEKKILWLEDMQNGEPSMHGRIVMSPDYVDLLTYGTHKSPQFSISFPAKKIAPLKPDPNDSGNKNLRPTFNDLVIQEDLMQQIDEIKSWLKYNDELMNNYGMKYKLKKGYRTLFYGPPGTGKTFTAQILGNDLNKEVFKIDLSMVVSKYIGETEKNLELLFARAEDKSWILFFDEADALFGKRTNVRDAHDKYANQEVSYLLQRIEDYNGLVILATNMKNNIDDAFIRRFNSLLKFPFPDQNQRALIWEKALPKNALFRKKTLVGNPPIIKEEEADIPEAVKKYELTGGNIINVVHYACIKAIEALHEKKDMVAEGELRYQNQEQLVEQEHRLTIYLSDVIDGIKRELIKEGKPFTL